MLQLPFDSDFFLAQALGALGAFLMFLRMGKKSRKDFNLYHTYFCIPLAAQFAILQAWMMVSLCIAGATRTLLLSTDWGWKRRTAVVAVCLCVPVITSVITATNTMDWILLAVTILAISSEALKSFLNIRSILLCCSQIWIAN